MKKLFLFPFVLLLLSCSNDSDDSSQTQLEETIEINTYYKLANSDELYPDIDSDIFVYYSIYSLDVIGYELGVNGTLIKNGKEPIEADRHLKADVDGECSFFIEKNDQKITVLIRSNHFKNLISQHSFSNSKSKISIRNIFDQ